MTLSEGEEGEIGSFFSVSLSACRPSWTKIDRFRFSYAKSGALDLDETSNFRVATKRQAKSDRLLPRLDLLAGRKISEREQYNHSSFSGLTLLPGGFHALPTSLV